MTTPEQTFQMVADPQGKIVGVLAGVEYITAKEAETLIAENAALRSEVEQLTADAKRYRVVRSWNWTRSDGCPHIKVGLYDNGKFLGHYDYLEGDSLDAWVDKELEQK